ncbi:PREDICTED: centromere protein T-like [Priapulus caudatus]|uniref:Centromere protein T-like n=1 Tax=Priapulus caudatus TaxID=37621 RepID=A0ABM1EGC8_PRICU|nr:PREDICTED: centromere protein T-like [Priapulus caudatus]
MAIGNHEERMKRREMVLRSGRKRKSMTSQLLDDDEQEIITPRTAIQQYVAIAPVNKSALPVKHAKKRRSEPSDLRRSSLAASSSNTSLLSLSCRETPRTMIANFIANADVETPVVREPTEKESALPPIPPHVRFSKFKKTVVPHKSAEEVASMLKQIQSVKPFQPKAKRVWNFDMNRTTELLSVSESHLTDGDMTAFFDKSYKARKSPAVEVGKMRQQQPSEVHKVDQGRGDGDVNAGKESTMSRAEERAQTSRVEQLATVEEDGEKETEAFVEQEGNLEEEAEDEEQEGNREDDAEDDVERSEARGMHAHEDIEQAEDRVEETEGDVESTEALDREAQEHTELNDDDEVDAEQRGRERLTPASLRSEARLPQIQQRRNVSLRLQTSHKKSSKPTVTTPRRLSRVLTPHKVTEQISHEIGHVEGDDRATRATLAGQHLREAEAGDARVRATESDPHEEQDFTEDDSDEEDAAEAPPRRSATRAVQPATSRRPANPRQKLFGELPVSMTKFFFSLFSQRKVARDAWEEVLKCERNFFVSLSADLYAYARHAGRHTIQVEDVELLMKRQGFINDKVCFSSLVEKHLPLEYRRLLLPCAQSRNAGRKRNAVGK